MATENEWRIGDCVLTTYGAGVISRKLDNGFFVVRLWRQPGSSIASASKGTLHESAILRKLSAAPGMKVLLTNGISCVVLAYYGDRNEFVVQNQEKSEVVKEVEILRPLSAKYYPVLEIIIEKANVAAVAAASALTNESAKKILPKVEQGLQNALNQATSAASSALEKSPATMESPKVDESIDHALKLIKDEELTVLFMKCKERLEEIVQKDIPKTTKESLSKLGIQIEDSPGDEKSPVGILLRSREKALSSLQDILDRVKDNGVDLEESRVELARKFKEAYDSVATAAKSDRNLMTFFEDVKEKTASWQKAAGRVMGTRSVGLFSEGAGRIHSRAATILSKHNFDWAGELGSKLAKSFTEGDAAVAKVKSLEVGESIKNRLVVAIQAQSEARGGLDGIIAKAFSSIRDQQEKQTGSIVTIISDLQRRASDKSLDTRESLISLLSQRGALQENALLRIEAVLFDLEGHFGEELDSEEIASIVRGERGTASIFEPIAKKAGTQIDGLLSDAEKQVKGGPALSVLKKIRQILSGDLSVSSLTDELVKILDDDKILSAGQSIAQHSEHVLDAIEGVTDDKSFHEAIKIAEKAGISKDSVLREVEKLDVNKFLDDAGNAISDEQARRRFISNATDAALDFILRILPSMPVPPFEGVNDGLVFSISNLSLQGFQVKKENIHLYLAGFRATKVNNQDQTDLSADTLQMTKMESDVKASELLVIDVQHISAILNHVAWSFEQTYLPYLKGDGVANVKMSEGAIRLQFELRRQRNANGVWEPVLCLNDRSCSIDSVELTFQGDGKLAWILGKLASVFKGPLRDYVVKTIIRILSANSGIILERLNSILSPYWGLIMKTAKLDMVNLAEVRENDIVRSVSQERSKVVELVWRDRLPLGMNLLMNDSSGKLKVVDFPRGSQARLVCEKRRMEADIFKGSTIVSVNGKEFDDQEDLFNALRDPGRPKSVGFQLADSDDAERVRQFVEGPRIVEDQDEPRSFSTRTVVIKDSCDIGLQLRPTMDGFGWWVSAFCEGEDGTVLAAERSGQIEIGNVLTHVNDKVVLGTEGRAPNNAVELLETEGLNRPLSLTFVDAYQTRVTYNREESLGGPNHTHGPAELLLEERKEGCGKIHVVIGGFQNVSGTVENSNILIGDHLVFVNGIPVGAGVRWLGEGNHPSLAEVETMLSSESFYPLGLTFARPRQKDSRWESSFERFDDSEAETICVSVERREKLGCTLYETEFHDMIVRDFVAIEGSLQRAIKSLLPDADKSKPSIEWINGDFVPSYASPLMVRNALKRAWKTHQSIDLWLCDHDRKKWLKETLSEDSNEK